MRIIEFWEYVREGRSSWIKGPWKRGKFHQFGCNYEEFDSGAGNYTTCIIECDYGAIKNIPVENCRFIKED